MSFQSLTIVGYLGNDPELRFFPNGSSVTNFSVATSRSWTKDGVKHDETTWFRVSVFGNQSEACNEHLHKGSLVLVVGRLKPDEHGNPRTYQRKDGTTGASFEVTADNVRFLGGKGDYEAPEQNTDEEIPF